MSDQQFYWLMQTIIIVAILALAAGMTVFFDNRKFLWLIALIAIIGGGKSSE